MDFTDKIVTILVQGGLAGIALASLYFNYKIVSNHMAHFIEQSQKLEIAITKLIEFLTIKLK